MSEITTLSGEKNGHRNGATHEFEKMLPEHEDVDEVLKNMPITDDIRCGIGFIRGRLLQK